MDCVTYTEFRGNLTSYINQVCKEHKPLLVTNKMTGPIVVMSKEDYDSLAETAQLLSNANNAKRLNKAIFELEAGQGVEAQVQVTHGA